MAEAVLSTAPSSARDASPLEDLRATTGVTIANLAALRDSDLAFGVRDHAEAALMLRVDAAAVQHHCEGWAPFLVSSLTDYLIWDRRPCGILRDTDARWLCAQIGEMPTKAGLALMVSLLNEAITVPHWFGAVVRSHVSAMRAESDKAPALRAA